MLSFLERDWVERHVDGRLGVAQYLARAIDFDAEVDKQDVWSGRDRRVASDTTRRDLSSYESHRLVALRTVA